MTDADGEIAGAILLTDAASKGRGGRVIPLNKELRSFLSEYFLCVRSERGFDPSVAFVITTERKGSTSAQAIVNMFAQWYSDVGLIGCSSHSGRRTFITNTARKISSVGGGLRDVQALAFHSSLAVTQRYIEGDGEARVKVVEFV